MHSSAKSGRQRGVTIVEVIVASAILGLAAAYSLAAMIVAARIGRAAQTELIGIQVLNRVVEQVRGAPRYVDIGDTTAVPGAPGVGNEDDTTYTLDRTYTYDADIPNNSMVFNIEYNWWGFGNVTSATGTTLTVSTVGWPRNADGDVEINPVGHRVVIRTGAGRGQIADITGFTESSSTSGVLTTTCEMNGYDEAAWLVTPNNTSTYEIDAGKNCRIRVTWPGSETPIIRDVFVPFRPED